MAVRIRMIVAVVAALVLLVFGSAQAGTVSRTLVCYYVVEEGASSDGNSLFNKKMAFEPEVLRSYCPSTFSRGPTGFATRAEGTFAYQAETPVAVDRNGKSVLYEVEVRLRTDTPPMAAKTLTVTIDFADLRTGKGLVQPAVKAMEYAAAKAGMKSGWAWIISMKRIGPGRLEAVVGLAR